MKRLGLSVQVARGKVKSQEGRERREGIEVHVSTGYWLPGGLECQRENSRRNLQLLVVRIVHAKRVVGKINGV